MIHIVYGPPGGGKTTYVKKHMVPGDAVIDFDAIFQAVSFSGPHQNESLLFDFVSQMRADAEMVIPEHPEIRNWWIIRCELADVEQSLIDVADIVLIDPGRLEVLRRMSHDKNRPTWEKWIPIVDKWYAANG